MKGKCTGYQYGVIHDHMIHMMWFFFMNEKQNEMFYVLTLKSTNSVIYKHMTSLTVFSEAKTQKNHLIWLIE